MIRTLSRHALILATLAIFAFVILSICRHLVTGEGLVTR